MLKKLNLSIYCKVFMKEQKVDKVDVVMSSKNILLYFNQSQLRLLKKMVIQLTQKQKDRPDKPPQSSKDKYSSETVIKWWKYISKHSDRPYPCSSHFLISPSP